MCSVLQTSESVTYNHQNYAFVLLCTAFRILIKQGSQEMNDMSPKSIRCNASALSDVRRSVWLWACYDSREMWVYHITNELHNGISFVCTCIYKCMHICQCLGWCAVVSLWVIWINEHAGYLSAHFVRIFNISPYPVRLMNITAAYVGFWALRNW